MTFAIMPNASTTYSADLLGNKDMAIVPDVGEIEINSLRQMPSNAMDCYGLKKTCTVYNS